MRKNFQFPTSNFQCRGGFTPTVNDALDGHQPSSTPSRRWDIFARESHHGSSRRASRAAKASSTAGFTLIETLVAVTLLSIAIVAPMSLVAQSLASAYYARDQVTAFNLAQEGIEVVRSVRDGNILQNALLNTNTDLLAGIPIDQNLIVDARQPNPALAIQVCPTNPCPQLQTDGLLYGYESGWTNTVFTRTVRANYIGGSHDEIRVSVTVSWPTASFQTRTFTIYEDMYRWVSDGSAAR